ncbi:DUF3265 domain-containing protein [Moritella sp. Urea-trap-13]|nr:DUF3265 domain-containing protein [Moritella sp. Urea-trap-13]
MTKLLSNCSSGIPSTWHFYYALVLVFKVVCGSLNYVAHP